MAIAIQNSDLNTTAHCGDITIFSYHRGFRGFYLSAAGTRFLDSVLYLIWQTAVPISRYGRDKLSYFGTQK